jgi:hypothetical protein
LAADLVTAEPVVEEAKNTPTIDADFPGGNILVDRIEGERVDLRQDPRDTEGFWFYWYFRVSGTAGRTLAFHFTDGNVIGVRGPAVSVDGGENWTWLGAEAVSGTSFRYTFGPDADRVRFCLAMPYQEADLEEFLARHADNPHLKIEPHATTRAGRAVRRLRLGQLDAEPAHRVLLTCRHHCCEMMASWTLEGLLEAVLADTPDGRWAREKVEWAVVPFMDQDGVQQGDQGKNRKPHDHNRDYLGESIYPTVAALKEFVPRWSGGKLRIALDLHCPYIRGGGDGPSSNQRIFFVGGPSQENWERIERLSSILQETGSGPLRHQSKHNIPWGQAWNALTEPRSFSQWAASLPDAPLATTLEIPYADVAGAPVTTESARRLGQDLLKAIRKHIEDSAEMDR